MNDPHARLGEYIIPSNTRPTLCKSCQAQIVWVKTGLGVDMPLSLATVRLGSDGRRWALTHFSDCPNAAQHRKPAGQTIDLRDLPNYLDRHHLVVSGSTIRFDKKGNIIITLQTRKT